MNQQTTEIQLIVPTCMAYGESAVISTLIIVKTYKHWQKIAFRPVTNNFLLCHFLGFRISVYVRFQCTSTTDIYGWKEWLELPFNLITFCEQYSIIKYWNVLCNGTESCEKQ